jgi:polyisoprenoid-binding protein YceI
MRIDAFRAFRRAGATTLLAGVLVATSLLPAGAQTVVEIENVHSSVNFGVPISGDLSRVTGRFGEYDIKLYFDESDPEDLRIEKARVEVVIQVSSIDTGYELRDEYLQGDAFFDAANHPEIRFESSRIRKTRDGYLIVGELSMRGVTREVRVPMALTGTAHTQGDLPVWGFSIRWTVNRIDYDIGTDWINPLVPDFLGKDISIEIDAWTRPPVAEGPEGDS